MSEQQVGMISDERGISRSLEGKYLTFAIASERYGMQILKVQEIIGMMHVTKVPGTENFLKGVINLRGKIIPIVDLRLKFGLDEIPANDRTCIIVVQTGSGDKQISVGLIVDTVLEVINFAEAQLEPAPDYGASLQSRFLLGMARTQDNSVVILVDICQVLGDITVIQASAPTNT